MSLVRMRNKLKESGKHGSGLLLGLLFAVVITSYFGIGGGGSKRALSEEEKKREAALKERNAVVATVGDTSITRAELDQTIDRSPMASQITPIQKHIYYPMVLSQLTDQALMVNEAKKAGVTVDSGEVRAEVDKRVDEQAAQMGVKSLTNKAQQRQFIAQIRADIDEKAVRNELLLKKFSDKLKSKVTLTTPGIKPNEIEVGARHILISYKGAPGFKGSPEAAKFTRTKAQAKAFAEKLLAEAKANPQGFAVLAEKNTDDPSGKSNGGDLGYFTRDRMVKPFADAAFKAKNGDIVGPVETVFGYHIIKVQDRRVAESRAQQEVTKFLEEARKKTKPNIVAPDLKAYEAYREYQTARYGAKPDKKAASAKLQAAIAAYKAAQAARPTDGAVSFFLAQLCKEAGDTKNAIANMQKAADSLEGNAQVHLALGALYQDTKQVDKALEQYKIAGRMADADISVNQQLYMRYKQLNQPELAKAALERVRNAAANQQQSPMPIGG